MKRERCNAILFAAVTTLMGIPSAAFAQTSYPMLMSLKPTAVQVGQTSECVVQSRYNLAGAYKVLITGDGVTGEPLLPDVKPGDKPSELTSLKVRFTVAPDAKPSVRDFRIATPQGVSTVGQLVLVRDPVIGEQPKNDSLQEAQQVAVPSTVCGTIERAEDVDFVKFHVDAPTALSFHVRSMRLQDRIHDLQQHIDPILTLRNATGTTLAASDNYFFGDPFLGYRFEQPGDYFLEIRDVRFEGNQYWEYCIEINGRPFVSNVFPMAVNPGQTAQLQLIGFAVPEVPQATLTVPMTTEAGCQSLPLPMGDGTTNPAPLVVTDLPVAGEAGADNNAVANAQPLTVPGVINGRIESESDIDCYAFESKKGEKFSFEVIARRQQSGLDSHLRILNEQGQQLALNDDLRFGVRGSADSWLEDWTAPADGKFVVEIRDVHLRGGPQYVYALEVTRSQPYFELFLDTDKTELTPGTNGVLFVRVARKNGFTGEVQLHVDGLPAGVTAACGRILAGKGQDGCIILQAAPDAPMSVANLKVTGTGTHAGADGATTTLTAVAHVYQETYQPGGGRGHWPVETHAVSVGAPSDLRAIKLSQTDVVLKPGLSQRIDVVLDRAAGFDKNVTLDVLFKHLDNIYGSSLPEGVTVDLKNSKTLLSGKTSEGYITLIAADSAPPAEKQLVPVMAHASINFVMKATYCGSPVFVTVQPK
jgi:hypothetical protein